MYALDWEIDAPDFTAGLCAPNSAPRWDYDIADEDPDDRNRRFDESLAQCDACPIKRTCRAWAEEHELSGLWGGQIYVPKPNDSILRKCETCGQPVHGKRKDNRALDTQRILCRICLAK